MSTPLAERGPAPGPASQANSASISRTIAAPYFTARGFVIAALMTLVLCWPMLVAGGPLYHFDTANYFDRGEQMADVLWGATGAEPGAGAGSGSDKRIGMKVRSLPYSLYTYLAAITPLGLYLVCLLQGAVVVWAFFALVPRLDARATGPLATGPLATGPLATGFAVVAGLSSLPWFVSYAMPDILGGILPIYYICLLGRFERLLVWQRWMLALLTVGAITAHYGNLPLAAALAAGVIGWRAWRRTIGWRVAAFAIGPVAMALALNVAGGTIATAEASAAPKRLPILLARSLEDGPARWYLESACPQAEYAMCDLFETIPDNISSFLWAEQGYRTATDAQVEAIRAEENAILWEAFKRYPVQQSRALLGNAALQTIKVGTDDAWPLAPGSSPFAPQALSPPDTDLEKPAVIELFDTIVPLATLVAALIYVAAALTGRISRSWVRAGLLLGLALAVNAAVFGGLSAPVDRYQGRLVWLIPALLALALTQGRIIPERTRRGVLSYRADAP